MHTDATWSRRATDSICGAHIIGRMFHTQGKAVVDAPNSKNEVRRTISSLHKHTDEDAANVKSVLLCIPRLSGE